MDSLEIDDIICPKKKCDSLYQVIVEADNH